MRLFISFLLLVFSMWVEASTGKLDPSHIKVALPKKTNVYLKNGLVVGGDHAIDEVIVLDLRRSLNKGFERVVIDLDGNRNGEAALINRPPYYQFSMIEPQNRMMMTIWGAPKLAFDKEKIKGRFKKSQYIQNVSVMPVVEKDRWNLVFEVKPGTKAEVFELKDPVRLIVDFKQ